MGRRSTARGATAAAILTALLVLAWSARPAGAVHESTNTLAFAPVEGSPAPGASGEGVVDYRGGGVFDSRWTVQLRFAGLTPGETYVAVLKGRLGATGSPEADVFSPLCTVVATATGDGGCWWYLVRMEHVDVVQLRVGSADGPPVVQATRKGDGPGSVTSEPNAFSPPEASPVASPAASPVASPSGAVPPAAGPLVR